MQVWGMKHVQGKTNILSLNKTKQNKWNQIKAKQKISFNLVIYFVILSTCIFFVKWRSAFIKKAGYGTRTHVANLEDLCSTTELNPHENFGNFVPKNKAI